MAQYLQIIHGMMESGFNVTHIQNDRTAGFMPVWEGKGSGDGFSFSDILDMLNPLQHVPVIGHIYRAITGDTIKPVSNVIGGAIFGGPVGAAAGLANAVVQEETGKDIASNVVAMVLNTDEGVAPVPAKAEELPGTLIAVVDLRAHDMASRYNA